MRRLTWLALLLLIALLLPAATAAPVSRGRLAATRFTVTPTSGGSWELELTVSRTDLGDRLEVGVQRCFDTCAPTVYYAGALGSGALQLDGVQASGSLLTAVRGTALRAAWSPAPDGSLVIGGTHGGGTADDFAIAAHRDDPAAVRLSVGGQGCEGRGYVGDAIQVATGDTSRATLPLRALRLPSGRLHCDAPDPLL